MRSVLSAEYSTGVAAPLEPWLRRRGRGTARTRLLPGDYCGHRCFANAAFQSSTSMLATGGECSTHEFGCKGVIDVTAHVSPTLHFAAKHGGEMLEIRSAVN